MDFRDGPLYTIENLIKKTAIEQGFYIVKNWVPILSLLQSEGRYRKGRYRESVLYTLNKVMIYISSIETITYVKEFVILLFQHIHYIQVKALCFIKQVFTVSHVQFFQLHLTFTICNDIMHTCHCTLHFANINVTYQLQDEISQVTDKDQCHKC